MGIGSHTFVWDHVQGCIKLADYPILYLGSDIQITSCHLYPQSTDDLPADLTIAFCLVYRIQTLLTHVDIDPNIKCTKQMENHDPSAFEFGIILFGIVQRKFKLS